MDASGGGAPLTGWRRVGASAVVLVLVAFNGAMVAAQVVGRAFVGDIHHSLEPWFPVMHPSALGAGAVATLVAATLVIRGKGSRATLALALSMAAFTACSLGMLSLFTPWDLRELRALPGAGMMTHALTLLPALMVVGTAAFLRFAVLFPRPLGVDELKRVGRVEAGDSLGVLDRAIGRVARAAMGRKKDSDPARASRASWLPKLVPERIRRWASQPVVVGSGRFLTDPAILWRWALGLAFVPYMVWWGIEVLPPALGWDVRPSDLEAVAAALILSVWIIVPVGGPILAVAILRLGYGLADEPDRRRMRWIVESLNAAAWLLMPVAFFILLAWVGIESPVLEYLPAVFVGILPLIVVVGFAVAVFYDGALEPSLVIRKSTLYGFFGFALALLFAITEEMVTGHMTAQLGLPEGTGTLVASGVIAVVFGVFHGRFNRKVRGWLDEEGTGQGAAEPDRDYD